MVKGLIEMKEFTLVLNDRWKYVYKCTRLRTALYQLADEIDEDAKLATIELVNVVKV